MKQKSGKKRATKTHVGYQNNLKRQEVGDDLDVSRSKVTNQIGELKIMKS